MRSCSTGSCNTSRLCLPCSQNTCGACSGPATCSACANTSVAYNGACVAAFLPALPARTRLQEPAFIARPAARRTQRCSARPVHSDLPCSTASVSRAACSACLCIEHTPYAIPACSASVDTQCAVCDSCNSSNYAAMSCNATANTLCLPCTPMTCPEPRPCLGGEMPPCAVCNDTKGGSAVSLGDVNQDCVFDSLDVSFLQTVGYPNQRAVLRAT